jgi:hypothetical protein
MDDAGIDDTVDQWLEVARDLLGEGDDAAILARADHAVDLPRRPGPLPDLDPVAGRR